MNYFDMGYQKHLLRNINNFKLKNFEIFLPSRLSSLSEKLF